MKCPQCGNSELQEHDRFCCECGCCLDGKPSCERKMKCPQCGNSNIQQHHRFCCECGFCLDGKPLSTATTLLQTSSQQTTSQLKSTPTGQLQHLNFVLYLRLILLIGDNNWHAFWCIFLCYTETTFDIGSEFTEC